MNKIIIPVLGLLMIYMKSEAQQSTFKVDAEFRPKFLLDNGYKKPKMKNDDPVGYISQRTRLNINYANSKMETYISLQDVRYWGGEDNFKSGASLSDTRSVDLHQAWFRLNPSDNFSIKTGRQLFSYDDQRLLSARGWNDYQVSYDALLFIMEKEKSRTDLAVSWNADNTSDNNYPPEKFKTLDFIRHERTFGKLNVSVTDIVTGNTTSDTTSDIYYRNTAGANVIYKANYFDIKSSFYYQCNLNDAGEKSKAYLFSVFGRYLFAGEKINLGMGVDYISGHDATNTGSDYQEINHTFDLLYGKRHGYYGYMDYFNTIPAQGLQDYMIKLNYKLKSNLSFNADYHHFLLAADSYDPENPSQKLNKNLGDELDFVFEWKPVKEIALQAGYCFYLTSDSLEKLKNVYSGQLAFPQLVYVMITVKPQLFSDTKEKTN